MSSYASPAIEARAAQLEVALHAELPDGLIDGLRADFPGVQFLAKSELVARPERVTHAEVLFTQVMDARTIAAAPRLRWVQTYGAGVEWLLNEAVVGRQDLIITNARGIHADPIAEHVLGLMLTFARKLDGAIVQQQRQAWEPRALTPSLRTLRGATLGIVGLGAIGQRLAELAQAFGMRVVGTRQSGAPTRGVERTYGPEGLFEVLAASEYVVNALPLTAQTRNLFDRAAFAALRPGAVFINIGRGGTVHTDALVGALQEGRLGAALLDVTEPEPLPPGHPLWTLPNVIITPHYAGAHPRYEEHVLGIFRENLRRYLAHQPLTNLVDKRAGY